MNAAAREEKSWDRRRRPRPLKGRKGAVARPAVQGSAGRRKAVGEVEGGPTDRLLRVELEAAVVQQAVKSRFASIEFRDGEGAIVADGGGVDDEKEARDVVGRWTASEFAGRDGGPILTGGPSVRDRQQIPWQRRRERRRAHFDWGLAILGTDVDRRFARKDPLGKQFAKLARIIVGKDDGVARKWVPARSREHRKCVSRQRAIFALDRLHRPRRLGAKETGRERLCVAGMHDQPRRDLRRFVRPHADDPPVANDDLRDGRFELEGDPLAKSQLIKSICKGTHAAGDMKDPLLLDVGDEGECRRGGERGGAAVGRVAPEELLKARIVEARRERLMQGPQAVNFERRTEAALGEIPEDAPRGRPLGDDERLFDGVPNRLCRLCEGAKVFSLFLAEEAADLVDRGLDGVCQVEGRRAILPRRPPRMAGNDGGGVHRHVVPEALPAALEELFKDPRHREDGRSTVDGVAFSIEFKRIDGELPAGGRPRFEDGHAKTGTGKVDRGDHPCDACTDNHRLIPRIHGKFDAPVATMVARRIAQRS